jgi:hypothetical protein
MALHRVVDLRADPGFGGVGQPGLHRLGVLVAGICGGGVTEISTSALI